MLTKTQKNEKGPISHQKIKCSFLDYVQILMIGRVIWANNMLTKMQKNEKGPLSHRKIKCSFLDYIQLLMISQAIQANNMLTKMHKNEEGSLRHQKIKCSFLDYIQLLMIGRVIWAKNVDRNTKKWRRPPKSLKNKRLVFGLCSTSDDWPSNPSKKRWPKHKKMKKAP